MGAEGPAGVIDLWMVYKDFSFDSNNTGIRSSDMNKAADIAAYIQQNPSLQVGIDAYKVRDQDLRDRRINTVRAALIQAGVPAERISTGAFCAPNLRGDARVVVMIKTSPDSSTSKN
jgi:hypothetical protein